MAKLPKIKNSQLLKTALTHRSSLNESREKIESNERLEFLGDSILSFVVSSYLYTNYPEFDEGKLTNLRSLLVNTKMLANCASEAGLGKMLRLSKGEEEGGGRENPSILADVFEAYIGALFLDQGIEEGEKLINSFVLASADDFILKNLLKDPKSKFQEYVQSKKKGSPKYIVLEEKGPAHKREFSVGVYVEDKLFGKGSGPSKQKAEEEAAIEALEKIKSESIDHKRDK